MLARKKSNSTICTMCHLSQKEINANDDAEQLISHHDHMYVTRNIFPYTLWDGSPVSDHLMVVPRRHIVSLSELTTEEKLEWTDLVTFYEKQNYSVYARSADNSAKSIVHQHTHLIRVAPRPKQLRFTKSILRILLKK